MIAQTLRLIALEKKRKPSNGLNNDFLTATPRYFAYLF